MAAEAEAINTNENRIAGACGACACAFGVGEPAADKEAEVPEGERGERSWWRVAAAEAVGAALLVALSCLPGAASPPPPPAVLAIAAGAVVALLVQCFDQISGAMFNPTVTVAGLVMGRLSGARAAVMAAAQVAGGAAGGLLLHAMAPDHLPGLGVTKPGQGISAVKAACIEAVLGACLALANCAAWDARNRALLDSWPLRIGAIVAALSLAAGELTGASMNPVRSLGPALAAADFQDHWVYWVGPLCGSAVATALYRALWAAPAATPRLLAALQPPRARPRPRPRPSPCPDSKLCFA